VHTAKRVATGRDTTWIQGASGAWLSSELGIAATTRLTRVVTLLCEPCSRIVKRRYPRRRAI